MVAYRKRNETLRPFICRFSHNDILVLNVNLNSVIDMGLCELHSTANILFQKKGRVALLHDLYLPTCCNDLKILVFFYLVIRLFSLS